MGKSNANIRVKFIEHARVLTSPWRDWTWLTTILNWEAKTRSHNIFLNWSIWTGLRTNKSLQTTDWKISNCFICKIPLAQSLKQDKWIKPALSSNHTTRNEHNLYFNQSTHSYFTAPANQLHWNTLPIYMSIGIGNTTGYFTFYFIIAIMF